MTAIAVIVAARDAAETLTEALASARVQTLAADELIVCDDGSTDGTATIAAAGGATVVSTTGQGPAAARRRAIEASTSELVALLDADDIWATDHLETLRAIHRPGVLPMADLEFWVPGVGIGRTWSSRFSVPRRQQLRRLYRTNYINSCTLFERQLYEQVGGFRGGERVGEDWDLWIRMLRAGTRVVMADHPTVKYRMRPAGNGAFADRLAVLNRAMAESASAAERRAIGAGLRRVRAEERLFDAYRSHQRPWGALIGSPRVAVRAAAMVVSPRWVGERRAAAVADRSHRLRG